MLAAVPFGALIADRGTRDNIARNLLLFKLLRIGRISSNFVPDAAVKRLVKSFFSSDMSRDEKIANERYIGNVIKIIK